MRAVAIDRSSNRTSGPVTILDLTKDEDMEFLENFIKSEKENIMLVHLAPPCGTSSAARNKRHPDLEAAGFDLPRPLRSRKTSDGPSYIERPRRSKSKFCKYMILGNISHSFVVHSA